MSRLRPGSTNAAVVAVPCATRRRWRVFGTFSLVQVEQACGLWLRTLAWLMCSRSSVSCCRGCGPWWRRRMPRTRSCGRSWRRSGGGSCGWRSWSAGCGWTAPIRARRPRRSRSGRENAAARGVRNRSGSAGRTAAGAGASLPTIRRSCIDGHPNHQRMWFSRAASAVTTSGRSPRVRTWRWHPALAQPGPELTLLPPFALGQGRVSPSFSSSCRRGRQSWTPQAALPSR